MKSVDIWGDDPTGWTIFSGEGREATEADYFKFIPTLYRAVQLNAYQVSTMPFQLLKGKTMYDESADWQNKVGFMPNPFTLLQLVNNALDMTGRCYLFRDKSQVATKLLRYHLPMSVTAVIDDKTGKLLEFTRPVNGVDKHFKPDDYVYFWLPDPYVEVGPAINYPSKAAANACGVILNLDLFANNYFERGAIKAMLLTVTGMPAEAEREKLSAWWKRVVSGVRNAFGAQIINADAIKPVVVGEGMKELENVTISKDKQEDIAIAMGIPMSILFSNSANYATAQQDELNYLNRIIVPRCQFIEGVLNEQVFEPLGLHWQFLPETLDAMQEDETERATSMNQFADVINKAGSIEELWAIIDIYGMELSDKAKAWLTKAFADKKAKADEMAERLANAPKVDEPQDEKPEDDTNADTTFKSELDKWKRKAINAMKKGKPANVDFVTTVIPAEICETIMSALGNAKSEDDVKGAFDVTQSAKPEFGDSIMVLANELKRANDILERSIE